jgi:hypothetical protein
VLPDLLLPELELPEILLPELIGQTGIAHMLSFPS